MPWLQEHNKRVEFDKDIKNRLRKIKNNIKESDDEQNLSQ